MCYKMTSGIQKHLMDEAYDPPIDAERYGFLNSAVSWANLVIPLYAGPLVDRRATRHIAVTALMIGLVGQVLFTLSVNSKVFAMGVFGRAVFGIGEGSVMIAQGAAIATWFSGAELTFAVAMTEVGHSIANWTGKIAVSMALEMGGWWITLWIGCACCAFGLLAGCMFAIIERKYESSDPTAFKKGAASSVASFAQITMSLWLILMIHLLVSNTEHLFDTVSTDFIQSKWHDSTSQAAWLSSLNYAGSFIFCPVAAILIDKSACRLPIALLACCLMGGAHLLLGLTTVTPAVALVALSFPQAIMPTILRASAPLVVNPSVFGMAFGAYNIAENAGKTVGGPLIGYIKDRDGNYLHVELGFATASFVAAMLVLVLSITDPRLRGPAKNVISDEADLMKVLP
jgi:MFS family permease